MKKIYSITACILIAIGMIHSVFGVIGAKTFNSEILWFISTGLLLSILGYVNLALAIRNSTGFDFRSIQIFNLLGVSFITLLVLADPMEVGFIALSAQIFNSFGSWNVIKKSTNCCGKYSNI